MRGIICAALLLNGCADGIVIKPIAGICDQPDPALAMMGTPPESLHEMVKSTCLVAGAKVLPKP